MNSSKRHKAVGDCEPLLCNGARRGDCCITQKHASAAPSTMASTFPNTPPPCNRKHDTRMPERQAQNYERNYVLCVTIDASLREEFVRQTPSYRACSVFEGFRVRVTDRDVKNHPPPPRWKPGVLRPGIIRMQGSMVIRLRPRMAKVQPPALIALGASNVCLVRENPTRSVFRDTTVYGYTPGAMHDDEYPPPHKNETTLNLPNPAYGM